MVVVMLMMLMMMMVVVVNPPTFLFLFAYAPSLPFVKVNQDIKERMNLPGKEPETLCGGLTTLNQQHAVNFCAGGCVC